eukprot:11286128-Alexandrium_andersonii.AAC.1
MLVSIAICPNPRSAFLKTQHRLRRLNVELRRPRNGLRMGPRSSRWGEFRAMFRAGCESANERRA